jgi:hypothetical protein
MKCLRPTLSLLLLLAMAGGCGSRVEIDEPDDLSADALPAASCDHGLAKCYHPHNGIAFCTDLGTDPHNCGDCSEICPADQTCSGGLCVDGCRDGLIMCNGKCIDPATDALHCAASGDCQGDAAGTACQPGEVCVNALCHPACPAGLTHCDGECIDPLTSNHHCGASATCSGIDAGLECPAGAICSAGMCAVDCQQGLIECSGKCINPLTSTLFCGASQDCIDANAGSECKPGYLCSTGACAINCQEDLVTCAGTCIDPLSSQTFCGADGDCYGNSQGTTCKPGETCYQGSCVLLCPPGMLVCDGICTNPLLSNAHCGAAADCYGPNAGELCAPGYLCTDGTCVAFPACGDGECNGDETCDDCPDDCGEC